MFSTKLKQLTDRPILLFSPFLVISLIWVLFFRTQGCFGDEPRYIEFSNNIINGFYSPPESEIYLPHGPGYPLLILPFIAFGTPLYFIGILNAFLHFLSIIFIYKTARSYLPIQFALIVSLFWAFYINAYQFLPYVLPETLSFFLAAVTAFSVTKAFGPYKKGISDWHLLTAGISIGYLVLTKVIFGYVVLVMLSGCFVLRLFAGKYNYYRKIVLVLLIALAFNIPYLIYTFRLTDKPFYWSTYGGNNLYWLTNPLPGEYGDYESFLKRPTYDSCKTNTFRKQYIAEYFEIVNNVPEGLKQDSAFKKVAMLNIKEHPRKIVFNIGCNLGRILFDIPYSYKDQDPKNLLRIPFNGLIAFFGILLLIPTIINWIKIDFAVRFMLVFSVIYLGGSLLGCAETRMFTVIVPFLILWIGTAGKMTLDSRIKKIQRE